MVQKARSLDIKVHTEIDRVKPTQLPENPFEASRMTLLFLDTEFTGLGQRSPHLISMGLVSEDGRHSFYAELTPESYVDTCSFWVQANILPLLEGGDRVMEPDTLRQRLTAWIGVLGDVRIVNDAPDYDFAFLRATLEPWPANVDPKPIRFDTQVLGDCHRETLEIYRGAYFTPTKPEHHSGHDARALRQSWQRAKALDAFQAYAVKLGL